MTVRQVPIDRRKRWSASAAAIGLAFAGVVAAAPAAQAGPGGDTPLVVPGNLLMNPSFESGSGAGNGSQLDGWTMFSAGSEVTGGTGLVYRMSNNPYSGSYGFGTGNGANNAISQTVTVPYSGHYKTQGYLTVGSGAGKLAVRDAAGGEIASSPVTAGSYTAGSPVTVAPVELQQGDSVTVFVNGSPSAWLNGDDVALTYDYSDVFYNLLTGPDLAAEGSVDVALPRPGGYLVSIEVTAGSADATVSVDGDDTVVPAGTTQTVAGSVTAVAEGDLVAIAVSGDVAEISQASFVFDVDSIPNDPPAASNVAVGSERFSGQVLTGTYDFTDPDVGQNEGASRFRWLVGDDASGPFGPIEGADTKSITVTDELEGKFLVFEVTPVDNFGGEGAVSFSAPVGPFHINWIRNPGREIESGGWEPAGWASSGSGVGLVNDPTNSRGGFRSARFESNATGGIAYRLSLPRDGYYDTCFWMKGQNNNSRTTTAGIRVADTHEVVASQSFTTSSTSFQQFCLDDAVALEHGEAFEFFQTGASGGGWLWSDDFSVVIDSSVAAPAYANILDLSVEGQRGDTEIDRDARTVSVAVEYGTDITELETTFEASFDAVVDPPSGSKIDFTESPVTFTVTPSAGPSVEWKVSVEVLSKRVKVASDNSILEDGFNWAAYKTDQFVVTDREVPFEKWEGHPATEMITGAPGYWAGYYDRSGYYGRDFAHQASGAALVGLAEENFRMLETFAKGSTEERKYYTPWAFNFDNETPLGIDYNSLTSFVREVPAQFELVQRAYEQYLWTGDARYVSPEMMTFYRNVMVDYVALHDSNGNGVAEGDPNGGGIFAGSATYNERGSHPLEAGDSIGSQYQATLAYAGFLRLTGDLTGAAEWEQKAADLKQYFNEDWSLIEGAEPTAPGGTEGLFVNILDITNTKAADWGKENSWFMPLKMITEPGPRNDAYLEFIRQNLGEGIGSNGTAPNNIEAYTYIPDTYFLYNQADEAWKWMDYILSIKDLPHERAVQGTNGDYPEISFTIVSQTVQGMMGIEPEASTDSVSTIPRLPSDVGWVEVEQLPMGEGELKVRHDGNTKTELTNLTDEDLSWTVRFYGEHAGITVDGESVATDGSSLNGEPIRLATVTVPAGESLVAERGHDQDIAALVSTIEEAEDLEESDYTTSSWAAADLASLITDARTVLAAAAPEQSEIDGAVAALADVIDSLVLRGDAEALRVLVTAAQFVGDRIDGFTSDSMSRLQSALAEAQVVLAAADDRTQDQLDAAATSLSAALDGLEVDVEVGDDVDEQVVSTLALQALVDAVRGLKNPGGIYTKASWAEFRSARSAAQSVLRATSATQAQVDAATARLTEAVASLAVVDRRPVKIKLNQKKLRLVKGTKMRVEEGVYYGDGLKPSYKGDVKWKSSKRKVATVTKNGVIKAKRTGTVTITVTTKDRSAKGKKLSAKIKVRVVAKRPKVKVTKVVANVPRSMKLGKVAYVTGRYKAAKATRVKVTYASSKPKVAKIDRAGRLVATGKGTTRVTVKAGGKKTTYRVTVK